MRLIYVEVKKVTFQSQDWNVGLLSPGLASFLWQSKSIEVAPTGIATFPLKLSPGYMHQDSVRLRFPEA